MKTKYRLENFSLYDHTGIAAHLERMASRGWMLDRISPFAWRYRKIEPQAIHFSVTYFPKADYYEPAPSDGELTFRTFCEAAGWKLAAASAQLQIFYNTAPSPLPLETDPMVQVENIHSAGKRSFLLANWLYIGLSILQLLILFGVHLDTDSTALYTHTAFLFGVVCWVALLVMNVIELLMYFRWRRKALRMAEDAFFLPTRSHPWVPVVCLILVFLAMGAWLLSTASAKTIVHFLVVFTGMMLLTALVHMCRELLKKKGASKSKNLVITLIVDLVLVFTLLFGTPVLLDRFDWGEPVPVDTYQQNGRTFQVYSDPLPLYTDALFPANRADYSCEVIQNRKGPLGWEFLGYQTGRTDRGSPDGLWYHVVQLYTESAFRHCWQDRIERGGGIWHLDEMKEYDRGYVAIDPTDWHAEEAYRIHEYGQTEGWYLLRWGTRFARLRLDWEPTAEQKSIIGDTLSEFVPE